MRVLGLDPGSNRLGYAVIEGKEVLCKGVIRLQGKPEERAGKIFREITHLIEDFGIKEAALEEVFLGKNTASLIKLAHARGALLAALGIKGVHMFEYHPSRIKKNITGNGAATKSQIMWMVRSIFGIQKLTQDEADAIAVAYCHLNSKCLHSYGEK